MKNVGKIIGEKNYVRIYAFEFEVIVIEILHLEIYSYSVNVHSLPGQSWMRKWLNACACLHKSTNALNVKCVSTCI